MRRHARYFQRLFDRTEAEWRRQPNADLLMTRPREIDNVRTALDWAFSAEGDALAGVMLSASSLPFVFDQCLVMRSMGGSGALGAHRWQKLRPRIANYRLDHATVARATLARVLWLQGAPEHAPGLVDLAMRQAIEDDYLIATRYVLVEAAVPLSLLMGDFSTARRLSLLQAHGQEGEPTHYLHRCTIEQPRALRQPTYVPRGCC